MRFKDVSLGFQESFTEFQVSRGFTMFSGAFRGVIKSLVNSKGVSESFTGDSGSLSCFQEVSWSFGGFSRVSSTMQRFLEELSGIPESLRRVS